ncbi:hypothetical protein [Streptomyces mordarskii]|uniref:Uncharacterized protein n=1 Tax=Streptomyces mordarskii TaxID=1226758 RepID=A0ABN1EJB3_9ACTN
MSDSTLAPDIEQALYALPPIGAPLARVEGQIALESLVRRFPGLRLGVPASEISHSKSPFIRSLTALPAEFEAQRPAG